MRRVGRVATVAVLLVLSSAPPALAQVPPLVPTGQGYSIADGVVVSGDGTPISIRLFWPDGATDPPGIITSPGWGFSKEITFPDADLLARNGFAVLAYTPRGFAGSGGLAGAAGPNERMDQQAVIDWFVANTTVDPDRLGYTGISYGAGHSYMAWVSDPRIRVIVPRQGWSSLYEALFPNGVPKLQVGLSLYSIGLAGTDGRLEPIIHQWVATALSQQDVRPIAADMEPRNWGLRVGEVTPGPRRAALIVQSFPDEIFEAGQGLEIADRIDPAIPTKLVLTPDGHGTVATNPLVNDLMVVWFRCFLADDAGACAQVLDGSGRVRAPVTYFYDGAYRDADRFPVGPPWTLWLAGDGTLTAQPGDPTELPLPDTPDAAIVAETPPLPDGGDLIGAPEVVVDLSVAEGDLRDKLELVALIEDVAPDGAATTVTHQAYGVYDLEPPERRTVRFPLRVAAHRVAPGHRLRLVLRAQWPPTYLPWTVPGTTTIHTATTGVTLPLWGAPNTPPPAAQPVAAPAPAVEPPPAPLPTTGAGAAGAALGLVALAAMRRRR